MRTRSVIAASMLALLLFGCGGGEPSATSNTDGQAEENAEASAAQATGQAGSTYDTYDGFEATETVSDLVNFVDYTFNAPYYDPTSGQDDYRDIQVEFACSYPSDSGVTLSNASEAFSLLADDALYEFMYGRGATSVEVESTNMTVINGWDMAKAQGRFVGDGVDVPFAGYATIQNENVIWFVVLDSSENHDLGFDVLSECADKIAHTMRIEG